MFLQQIKGERTLDDYVWLPFRDEFCPMRSTIVMVNTLGSSQIASEAQDSEIMVRAVLSASCIGGTMCSEPN